MTTTQHNHSRRRRLHADAVQLGLFESGEPEIPFRSCYPRHRAFAALLARAAGRRGRRPRGPRPSRARARRCWPGASSASASSPTSPEVEALLGGVGGRGRASAGPAAPDHGLPRRGSSGPSCAASCGVRRDRRIELVPLTDDVDVRRPRSRTPRAPDRASSTPPSPPA